MIRKDQCDLRYTFLIHQDNPPWHSPVSKRQIWSWSIPTNSTIPNWTLHKLSDSEIQKVKVHQHTPTHTLSSQGWRVTDRTSGPTDRERGSRTGFVSVSSFFYYCVWPPRVQAQVTLVHWRDKTESRCRTHVKAKATFLFPPGDESPPTVKYTWLEVKTQYLVVQLTSKLTRGRTYQLYTKFTGELADDLSGFYRSEYEEGGLQKYVLYPVLPFEGFQGFGVLRLFSLLGLSPPRRCIQLMPERPSLVLMNQQWRLFSL